MPLDIQIYRKGDEKMINNIKEWLKNRRVWAAILAAASAASISLGYGEAAQILAIIAGGLGLHSYGYPKD